MSFIVRDYTQGAHPIVLVLDYTLDSTLCVHPIALVLDYTLDSMLCVHPFVLVLDYTLDYTLGAHPIVLDSASPTKARAELFFFFVTNYARD